MGYHKIDFGEIFCHVLQLERVDILVPGDAAGTTLDAKVDQHRDTQLSAFLPDRKGIGMFNRLFDHGCQQLVTAQSQLFNAMLQPLDGIGHKGAVMDKADKAIGIPRTDFGQVFVATTGNKANRVDAIFIQLFDPTPRLFTITWVMRF